MNHSGFRINVYASTAPIAEAWGHLDRMAAEKIERQELSYIQYTFYQTFKWHSLLEAYHRQSLLRRTEYIAVEDAEGLVAILPLLISRFSKKVRMTSGKVAGVLNASCPCTGERAEQAMKAVLSFMRERYGSGWKWYFHDMPRHCPLFESLIQEHPSYSERGSYHIPLHQFTDFEAYVHSLGRNVRQNIRTAYNHLTTDGRNMQVHVYDNDSPPDFTTRRKIWAIYFRRKLDWKNKKATLWLNLLGDVNAFYAAAYGIESLSMLRLPESKLVVMTIDGEVAAFLHMYVHGPNALVPKLAIATSFSRYSPGILLIMETLKRLMPLGITHFDLCRGDEHYKQVVGGQKAPLGRITLSPHHTLR